MSHFRTVTAPLALVAALALGAGAAAAQEAAAAGAGPYSKQVEGSFDDVAFAVEQAITNEGLVIDSTHHVGEMLSRTKGDVGGDKDLYTCRHLQLLLGGPGHGGRHQQHPVLPLQRLRL